MLTMVRTGCLAAALVLAGSAVAQDPSKQQSRDRELLRRAQIAQKQSDEARAAVEAEKAALEAKLKDVEGRAASGSTAAARERRRAAELAAGLDAAKKEQARLGDEKTALANRLAKTEAQLAETRATLVRTTDQLAARDAEAAKLRTDLARTTTDRDDAVAKNAQFATLFSDLMTRYRNVGVAEVLRRAEPFTGLERSKVEGLLEEYRDRSDALRVGTEGATR